MKTKLHLIPIMSIEYKNNSKIKDVAEMTVFGGCLGPQPDFQENSIEQASSSDPHLEGQI